VTILAPNPTPVNSDPAAWPAWTDADRWELGTEGEPVAPYTTDDADWWAEQTRDDHPAPGADGADDDSPEYHAHLDRLADEREAEDLLCRGLLF
jgi:hypothetical protein